MKHLYYIRHGQSELNVKELAAGHTDTPLTEHGRNQAKKAGEHVKEKGIKFDLIISSPLQRALHTAQHIAELSGYPLDKIEINDELKERHFGELEGKHLFDDFGVSIEEYSTNPHAIDHIPEVEKILDLQKRADQFLANVKNRTEETILLVGHGAFARSLMRSVDKLSIEDPVKPLDNAKIIKLI